MTNAHLIRPDIPETPHDVAFMRAMLSKAAIVNLSIPTLLWLGGIGIG